MPDPMTPDPMTPDPMTPEPMTPDPAVADGADPGQRGARAHDTEDLTAVAQASDIARMLASVARTVPCDPVPVPPAGLAPNS